MYMHIMGGYCGNMDIIVIAGETYTVCTIVQCSISVQEIVVQC